MEYLYQNCEWEQDGLHTIPVMSIDAKASCWMYSFHHEPDVIYFGNLQVCPDARGEGRGKGILRFCEDMARRMGFYQISLKVRLDSWMQKWYVREGFIFSGLDDDDTENHVWLTKYLD